MHQEQAPEMLHCQVQEGQDKGFTPCFPETDLRQPRTMSTAQSVTLSKAQHKLLMHSSRDGYPVTSPISQIYTE